MGDSTNFVVVLAGQLLQEAEFLLRMGLHAAEVIEIIPGSILLLGLLLFWACQLTFASCGLELAIQSIANLTSEKELTEVISTSIAAKQYGYEDLLTKLVVQV